MDEEIFSKEELEKMEMEQQEEAKKRKIIRSLARDCRQIERNINKKKQKNIHIQKDKNIPMFTS